MKPLLVVNPASGGGRTGATFGAMLPVIERALGVCDVAMTAARGDAIDIAARESSAGRALLVAVGGDGTFSEVVNGVMRAKQERTGDGPEVATIAQGTGGDFRRSLALEHRLDAYLGAIASGRTRRIDVGRLRYTGDDGAAAERFFVNILSAGLGGLVDRYVEEASPRFGGAAKYALASLRALGACERGALRCQVGDASEKTIASYMLAICNGRYFGSGMHVAPMAKLDDGRFDVVSIDAPSKLAFALAARKIYDGGHLRERGATHFACSRISVELAHRREAGSRFLLDVDGEAIGALPIDVEVLPGAIALRA